MADKPTLHTLPPNPTVEQVVELFKRLTGKEPTQAEIDELKAKAVMGERSEDNQRSGRVIQPDATTNNADWPKRTQDVKTPRV